MIKTYLPGGPYKSFQVFTRREVTLFNLTQLRKKTKDKRERMPNAATFEKEKIIRVTNSNLETGDVPKEIRENRRLQAAYGERMSRSNYATISSAKTESTALCKYREGWFFLRIS